jgi:hypothetical protein
LEASNCKKEMILIVSPAFVKENTVLNYNVDDGYLKPLIDSIQNTFVRPILGSALFDQVQTQIRTNTVSNSKRDTNKGIFKRRFKVGGMP